MNGLLAVNKTMRFSLHVIWEFSILMEPFVKGNIYDYMFMIFYSKIQSIMQLK